MRKLFSKFMRIGFTGTREGTGMTDKQKIAFSELMEELTNGVKFAFHHGDCVNADDQADTLVAKMIGSGYKYKDSRIVVHPPIISRLRANCHLKGPEGLRTVLKEKEYLERNRDIVMATDRMIATPYQFTEELRSGTWSTIRYTANIGKKCTIIFPDGSLKTYERKRT